MATREQLAPVIGHRAVITWTGSPTGPKATTGILTWERPDELTGSAMLFLDPEDAGKDFLYLDPAAIVAATDLDQGGVVYDYSQPTDQPIGPDFFGVQARADAPKLWELRHRISALAAELDERLEDEDRDSGLILDGLPDRLRAMLGGS